MEIPAPTVEGPLAGAPFLATTSFDLAAVGYAQAEYFIAGTATAYAAGGRLAEDGRWAAAPAATAPYRTRLVVYRPADPARCSGTVVAEWLNVSGGLDAAPDWIAAHTELIREGHVWVGVSAQRVGVEGGPARVGVVSLPLKAADPSRYGALAHPGDSFSYDLFSQAGAALRRPRGADPLGGLRPARLIAAGESQSAFRLVTYINAVHPLARQFDAFLVHSRGAVGAPLAEPPQPTVAVPDTAAIRDDVDVPVLIFQTETDLTLLNYAAARQPDSARIRLWEVAGTAHADTYTVVVGMSDTGETDVGARLLVTASPLPGVIECPQPINSGPQHFVLKAAVAALDRWLRDGTPAPAAPRLALASTAPPALARDPDGNARGGIRTPPVEVPIATLSGDSRGESLLCKLFGTTLPFAPSRLATLYPDRAAYVSAVAAAADRAVAAGFIRPADAPLLKAAAAAVELPGRGAPHPPGG